MPSPPPLRWSDLPGRNVGVWGVGIEGRATLARLDTAGTPPVVVVDDHPTGERVWATNHGGLEALARCDVVVKSPGISRYSDEVAYLESAGVAVVGGLGLWLEEVGPASVIGVTGTKGKSTTASVAAHLANGLGRRAFLGGNVGVVPWSPDAPDPSQVDLWVIEVSSYQATDLWSSPAVVAVTSLHEDHLDWHHGVENYYRDKLSVCGRPGSVITIANAGDERLLLHADRLRPGPRWVDASQADEEDVRWTAALSLRGKHNVANALIAAACLEEMGVPGASDPRRLADAGAGYRPLPHRLETVAVLDGVEYVDDSLSTNVLPTVAAAEAFPGRPLAILAGGFDRDVDYRPLGTFVADRPAPTLVLTLPQNGMRIRDAVTAAGGTAVACSDLADAVRRATVWARPGAVVLLSPAAASYGLFRDYQARAEAFRAAVAGLGAGSSRADPDGRADPAV